MALCGSKTRSGEPCKRHAIPGSSRCKLHGGKSTGPKEQRGNKNAAKPGSIYSQFLTDAENDMLASIELGKVDDELRLTRIRLMRALARENEHGNTLEADSEKREPIEIDGKPVMVDGKPVEKVTITTKVRDYVGMIDRLTARIESLERTRAELLKANPPEQLPVARIEIEVVRGRENPKAPDDGASA